MDPSPARYGIGQPVRRVEDARFITGRGGYVDDLRQHGECHGALLLSPHAHARIRSVNTDAAKAAPGVLLVLTGSDVERERLGGLLPNFMPQDIGGPTGLRTRRPILVSDRARCVGDRVAFVVAERLDQARDAAELVEVDYEDLPATVGVEHATAPGSPDVWDEVPGNVCFTLREGDEAGTDAAFARAARTVALRLENNRLSPNSMEPRVSTGRYDPAADSFTLHTSSQAPHAVRTQLASHVFDLPETAFRVIAPDVGGGFGVKADAYPEDALVLWASRRLVGRPVRWASTRSEGLLTDNHGRDQVVRAEMALDAEGRILAIRSRALHAVGSYIVSAAVAPLLYSIRYTPGTYVVPHVSIATSAVFTHTAPLGVYRGAGRPEGIYVVERLLDEAAVTLGIGPDEIRRRNFIPPDAMPFRTKTGAVYDTGEFARLTAECQTLADWDGFETRRAASEAAGRIRGRGLAYYIEHAGIFNDRMDLRFDPSGAVTILAGTHSHGQGHATAFAQVASEWLGVPFEKVRFVQGDTDAVPFGRGTYAARSALLGTAALRQAADEVIAKGRRMAAHLMEAGESDVVFEDGAFRVAGTDKSVTMTDTAKAFYRKAGLPPGLSLGLDATGAASGDVPSYPNGVHVCEVEIDPDTGETRIDRYAVVDDVGRPINPMICEGQIQGGLAQGIGQALIENVVYDPDSGQLISGSFMDYAMPRADDMGQLETRFSNVPCATNPLGVKGVGESGSIGAPPAIMNAVMDALRPLGVRHLDMPATPARVFGAIAAARRDHSPARSAKP